LHVVSASKGTISLTDFISQCCEFLDENVLQHNVTSEFSGIFVMCDKMEVSDSESKSLVFIAGYVGYKVVTNKVDCELYKGELVTCQ
jgi:hypothetical protein